MTTHPETAALLRERAPAATRADSRLALRAATRVDAGLELHPANRRRWCAGMRSLTAAIAVSLLVTACDSTETPQPAAKAPVTTVALSFTDAAPIFVSEVEEVHEDVDGRVWFALYQLPGLIRVRFGETTTADTIGALGSAAGEFRMPFAVMDASGGGIWTLDGVARRLVGFTGAGEADSVLAVPDAVDQYLVRRDTVGNWITALSARTRNDSVPLVRVRSKSSSSTTTSTYDADTIAHVFTPAATVRIPMGQRSYAAPPEYAARDLWGALADGTVWIARGGTHQVDYQMASGARTVAGPRPFTPISSNDADRGLMRGLPAASGVPTEALQYAPVKGPFIEARAARDGEVWTWRTQSAPKTEERYTVFRPGVAETRDVTLPLYHRVVGLGAQSVYVAERLPDGRWRVTRHARPAVD